MEVAMNQDQTVMGRADLLKLFPNLKVIMAPIAAMRLRIICCLMAFWVIYGRLESSPREHSVLPELADLLPTPAVSGLEKPGASLTQILNLESGWLGKLPFFAVQIFCLAFVSTTIAGFSANRIFRNQSRSMIECLSLALRSWKSMLQVLLIGFALIILCRIAVWLFLAFSGLISISSVAAPLASVIYIMLAFTITAAAGLGCVAIAYDECSGAEGVSRGLSYILSRPGLAILLLTSTAASSRVLTVVVLSLLETYRHGLVSALTPWNPMVLLNSLELSVWINGLAIMYVRLREEVDGVPEAEVSR